MRILTFLVLLVLLLGAACDSVADPIVVTATLEPDDPTPTREVATWTPEPTATPGWDVSCLNGEGEPINPVVCPGDYRLVYYEGIPQAVPVTMDLRIEPITNGVSRIPTLSVVDGNLRLDVAGFAGEIGIQIPNIYLEFGRCYTLNVPLYFDFTGAGNHQNYWFDLYIHASNGDVADRDDRPVILTPGGQGIEFGYRPSAPGAPDAVWWGFAPPRTTETVWEFVYHATWAPHFASGPYIDIDAFLIQEQFNTANCR